MRIGELAERDGVSTSKIRFYEACGLLSPAARLANDYRDYGEHDLEMVSFIGRARSLGFTLSEIATHLRSPEGVGRKVRLRVQLQAKLAELDAHIEKLQTHRAVISSCIEEVRALARLESSR